MTLVLGHEIAHTFIQGRLAGLEESFASLAGYRSGLAQRMDWSWAERDPQNPKRLEAWPQRRFEEADPDRTRIDMAERQPPGLEPAAFGKGMWVIESLERRFGPDFMKRYFQLLEKEKVNHPLTLREVAEYMGRIAGQDLKPWFRSFGTWRSGQTRQSRELK